MDFRYLVAAAINMSVATEPSGAPTLTSPLGTTLSETTARLSVNTNKSGGTLYFVVTASATPPSAAQVKLGQDDASAVAVFAANQAVAAAGAKETTASGLSNATTYYTYFMHEDALAQQSSVAASPSFLTGDVTAPILTVPAAVESGETTADLSVTTDTANGTLYAVVTTSSTSPSAAQVKLGQNHLGAAATFADDLAISSIGEKGFAATGLTLAVNYYTYFMHEDGSSNQSAVAAAAVFATTPDVIAPYATFTTPVDGATNVSITSDLVITFNEDVQAGTGSVRLYLTDDTLVETFTVGTAAVVIADNVATMNPTSSLTNSAGYYVQITAGAFEDLAGNPYAGITDETSWNFTAAAAAAPIIANQALDFGALTRTGAGGVALTNTGGAITSASIDSGNTGTDWQISSAGIITPNQNGGLTAGPYALVCTFTNASGSDGATITITTSGLDADGNDLSVSWSASTIVEMTAATNHASLSFGDNILLRSGNINVEQVDYRIKRTGALVGTWTAPSLLDEDHPDKGYDLDTGNYVRIRPHAGASPVIGRISFAGGGGQAAQYMRFTDVDFYRPPLVSVSDVTQPIIGRLSNASTYAIDNCTFHSQSDAGEAFLAQVYSAVNLGQDCYFYDNEVYDIAYGIRAPYGSTGVQIIGNDVHDMWYDGIYVVPGNNIVVAWNEVYDGQLPTAGHKDFIQYDNSVAANVTGRRDIGNRIWVGAGDTDGQGHFGNGPASPYFYIDPVFAGNMIVLGGYANTCRLARFQNGIVKNNTVIRDPSLTLGGSIELLDSDGNDVDNNVTFSIIDTTPVNASTIGSDNVTVVVADYAASFDDPQSGASVTDPSVNFSNLAGSAADLLSPKAGAAGTGYVNYTTRETSFPWAASSATEPAIYRVQAGVMYVAG